MLYVIQPVTNGMMTPPLAGHPPLSRPGPAFYFTYDYAQAITFVFALFSPVLDPPTPYPQGVKSC